MSQSLSSKDLTISQYRDSCFKHQRLSEQSKDKLKAYRDEMEHKLQCEAVEKQQLHSLITKLQEEKDRVLESGRLRQKESDERSL